MLPINVRNREASGEISLIRTDVSSHKSFEITLQNPQIKWDYYWISENPNLTWEMVKNNPHLNWDYEYLSCKKIKDKIVIRYRFKIKN